MRLSLPIAVCLIAASACSGAQVRDPQPDRRIIALDPIEFKADRSGGKPEVFQRDRDLMYEAAMSALKAKQWDQCQKGFDRVLAEFPADTAAHAFAFNAGLCAMRAGRHAQAAERFAKSQVLAKGSRNARDALFMRGEALEGGEKWADAAAVYKSALEDPATMTDIGGKLGLLDELEAWARMGICLRRANEHKDADLAFKRVEKLYEDNREMPAVAESEWVARSYYERSEIYYGLFVSIRFKLPVDRMQRELEDKSNLFLKAETYYYRCVRMHLKPWSLAAGFRLGNLYQRFMDDIDNAEVPNDLDAYTLDVYRDELWNHTAHLAKRAIVFFDKNLELAERLGELDGEWAQKSREGKKNMEETIARNNIRRLKLAKDEAALLPQAPTPTVAPKLSPTKPKAR